MRPANLSRPRRSPVGGRGKSLYAIAVTRSLAVAAIRSPAVKPACTAFSTRATWPATMLRRLSASRSIEDTSRSARARLRRTRRSASRRRPRSWRSRRVRALRTSRSSWLRAVLPRRSNFEIRLSAPLRDVVASRRSVTRATARSRASRVAPTYTSAARSATLRPCFAVVLAARTLAVAASRVSFAAIVRARRPVDFDGALAAVERPLVAVERPEARVLVVLRAVLLRAVLWRLAGVAFRVLVVVVVVSAILVDQPLWV